MAMGTHINNFIGDAMGEGAILWRFALLICNFHKNMLYSAKASKPPRAHRRNTFLIEYARSINRASQARGYFRNIGAASLAYPNQIPDLPSSSSP
jgi:hypothetical protein